MRADLRVYWDNGDEPTDFAIDSRDVIAWEREHDRSSAKILADVPFEVRCWFAYRHLKPEASFDDWTVTVDQVLIVDSADPVPLERTPSSGDSAA